MCICSRCADDRTAPKHQTNVTVLVLTGIHVSRILYEAQTESPVGIQFRHAQYGVH